MSDFPITYASGFPNFAFNGATVVIPAAPGAYGVLELQANPSRNLYVDSFAVVHGPDCQLARVFDPSIPNQPLGTDQFFRIGQVGPTLIDDNLVIFSTTGFETFQGVPLTTGILRYGTTTLPLDPQEESFIVPSRQLKAHVSDVMIREFSPERFRVPVHIPAGTTGAIRCRGINEEVRLGVRWFEQAG